LIRWTAVAGIAIAAATAGAAYLWLDRPSTDERAIRARLEALRQEINTSTIDGLGTVAHAAQIGSYFTDDATIELGEGSAEIHGRDTIIGMAARLQPRTAAFTMELDDVSVEMVEGTPAADVLLTASFVRRSLSTGEESRDAREFALVCQKSAGTWRIARVTAVDTLR
jgi:hypothetical protein